MVDNTYKHTHICMCVFMYICICIHMHINTHIYMCVFVYMYIYIYIVNILKVLKCFLKKDGEDQLDRSCEKCRTADGRRGKEHRHTLKR